MAGLGKKRHYKQRACKGKRPYHSEIEATRALADMRAHTGQEKPMQVYKCRTGNHWHFGRAHGEA